MKILIISLVLVLAACGKKSESSGSANESKSVFSQWVDDGGVRLSLSGLAFGTQSYRLDLNALDSCNVVTEVTGDQSSGTVNFISSTYIQIDPSRLTTACADMVGVYDYYRESGNLVYGRRGARPIEYH
ncbi:MAG: hypothetical protein ACXWQE_00205 [Bdellovibrionales bacterium]